MGNRGHGIELPSLLAAEIECSPALTVERRKIIFMVDGWM